MAGLRAVILIEVKVLLKEIGQPIQLSLVIRRQCVVAPIRAFQLDRMYFVEIKKKSENLRFDFFEKDNFIFLSNRFKGNKAGSYLLQASFQVFNNRNQSFYGDITAFHVDGLQFLVNFF